MNEFDRIVPNGIDWSNYSSKLGTITNWNYNSSSGSPAICDGGRFKEIIELFNSNKGLVNSSIYEIDNDTCSGRKSYPEDDSVIILTNSIKEDIINIVEDYDLTSPVSITTTAVEFLFLIPSFIGLGILGIFGRNCNKWK